MIVRYGMVWYGIMYGMVRHGSMVVWYDTASAVGLLYTTMKFRVVMRVHEGHGTSLQEAGLLEPTEPQPFRFSNPDTA